jgi:hypothetical protein
MSLRISKGERKRRNGTLNSTWLGQGDQECLSQVAFPNSVASEKTNREDDWKPLETGQLLTGQIMGKNVSVNVRKIT